MSPYLFLFTAEVLGYLIRQSTDIKGLKVYDKEIRISQYADDTIIFLKPNEDNLITCLNKLNEFKNMSGLQMNLGKSNAIRLGTFEATLVKNINLNWPTTSFQYLGITIPVKYSQEGIIDLNYQSKVEEINKLISVWSLRNLTLYGKVTIIKNLLIPKIVYLLTILPNPQNNFFVEFQRTLFRFLWNGKQDRIKRSLLYNEYNDGGIKMLHIHSFCMAQKLVWIQRYFDKENDGKWKIFFKKKISSFGGNRIFEWNFSEKDVPVMGSYFWSDILKAWSGYRYFNPVKFKDVLNEPLWFNSHIRKKDGNLLYYKKWLNAGVVYVKDILNANYSFKSYDDITCRYGSLSFIEYLSLLTAFPRVWNDLLNGEIFEEEDSNPLQYLNVLLMKKKVSKFGYNNL